MAEDDTHIITQVECEQMLARALRRLDEQTHDFRDIQNRAAEAEADYRKAKGMKALAIIRASKEGKWSAAERDARIDIELDEERRAHLYAQAGLHSARESLTTLRARIEALRTINVGIRAQT